MRTKEEINRQILGLEAMKTWLPKYSAFGTNNHKNIDAQIDILNGTDIDDMEEGDWENEDEDNDAYQEAEIAQYWLDFEPNPTQETDAPGDLFETR